MGRDATMKACLVTLTIVLVIVLFSFTARRRAPAIPADATPSNARQTEIDRTRSQKIPVQSESATAVAIAHRDSGEPALKLRTLSQGESDFASGSAYNLEVLKNSLRLPPDVPEVADTSQAAGVYVSPIKEIRTPKEQQEEAFDMIGFDYEVAAPAASTVKFEFRTIAVDEEGEGWSAWREVAPQDRNQPIVLDRMAEKWQYRVLLAHEPGSSSEIRGIKIITHQDPVMAAALFNYDAR